jgi:twitching motility protein PilT
MSTTMNQELDQLLTTMIQSAAGISDLLFVADKPPQVEVHGALEAVTGAGGDARLTGAQIDNLAHAVINHNAKLLRDLAEHGSCDCSYSLRDGCRFRVNIYRQNGNYAMVMRRLQETVPNLDSLKLPPAFREIIKEKNGLILVTGGSGNGKTTTLAAMLNEINLTSKVHVVTLEDPIEFLHPQLNATFSQRELGRYFYNFPDGLRAALRQAPKVILVGEIRDRETLEIALTAGETGHLVFSTLHTISAGQTINRILGMFGKDEEQQVRERLVGSLRYIVGQRLVPQKTGGRLLVTEMMGSSLRTREAIELGEAENRRLADIIEAGNAGGWHSFEQSLLKAYEEDLITEETALLYSINKPAMRQRLDLAHSRVRRVGKTTAVVQMITVPAAAMPVEPPVLAPIAAPAMASPAPEPPPTARNGVLKSMLNSFI